MVMIPPPASFGHGRQQALRHVKEVCSHRLKMDEPIVALGFAGFRWRRAAGVPNENVNPACLRRAGRERHRQM